MSEIERAKRLSQPLVHFATARARLCTDQRMSGLPLLAKYKHFRILWTILRPFPILPF